MSKLSADSLRETISAVLEGAKVREHEDDLGFTLVHVRPSERRLSK